MNDKREIMKSIRFVEDNGVISFYQYDDAPVCVVYINDLRAQAIYDYIGRRDGGSLVTAGLSFTNTHLLGNEQVIVESVLTPNSPGYWAGSCYPNDLLLILERITHINEIK